QRCQREEHETADEHAPAAEKVGEPAAEQQEAAERQRVGVDDPREVVLVEVERAPDRRQRDVDDRGVEDDHELRQGEEREREQLVAPGGGGHVAIAPNWKMSSGSGYSAAKYGTVPPITR